MCKKRARPLVRRRAVRHQRIINIKNNASISLLIKAVSYTHLDVYKRQVPGPAKWMGCMGREFEVFIPWCRIVKIGPDIILVDIDEKEAKHKVK